MLASNRDIIVKSDDILQRRPLLADIVLPGNETEHGVRCVSGKRSRVRRIIREQRRHIHHHRRTVRRPCLYLVRPEDTRSRSLLQSLVYRPVTATVERPQRRVVHLHRNPGLQHRIPSRETQGIIAAHELAHGTLAVIGNTPDNRSVEHIFIQQAERELHVYFLVRPVYSHHSFGGLHLLALEQFAVRSREFDILRFPAFPILFLFTSRRIGFRGSGQQQRKKKQYIYYILHNYSFYMLLS